MVNLTVLLGFALTVSINVLHFVDINFVIFSYETLNSDKGAWPI